MLSNASDYDFVQGITNEEVLINGQIMPWRDVNYLSSMPPTAAPKCLRGEDVCWLWESVNARLKIKAALAPYSELTSVMQYSPKISKQPLVNINSKLRDTAYSYPYGMALSSLSNALSVVDMPGTETTTYLTPADIVNASQIGYFNYNNSPAVIWYTQKALSGDVMRLQFWQLGLYKGLMYQTLWPNYSTHWLSSAVHGGDGPVSNPTKITDKRCILGETISITHSGSKTYKTATKYTLDSIELTGNNPLYVDATKYIGGVSCLVNLYAYHQFYRKDYYGDRTNHRNYIVPCQIDENNKIVISKDTLLQIAQEYKQHNTIKFVVDGEMPMPDWETTWNSNNSRLEIQMSFMYPFITVADDYDIATLNWDWTPS